MRILVVGAGGLGSAVAAVARRHGFFERMTIADLDIARAQAAVAPLGDERFAAMAVDASDPGSLAAAIAESRSDAVLSATDTSCSTAGHSATRCSTSPSASTAPRLSRSKVSASRLSKG